ncbi:MAG: hypothetical protein M1829_002232 [Trizodia sp. TS-e1964]|nr:MAG: hypothetical protein M1829_002232 [Trizodia sp. TS-e1964]
MHTHLLLFPLLALLVHAMPKSTPGYNLYVEFANPMAGSTVENPGYISAEQIVTNDGLSRGVYTISRQDDGNSLVQSFIKGNGRGANYCAVIAGFWGCSYTKEEPEVHDLAVSEDGFLSSGGVDLWGLKGLGDFKVTLQAKTGQYKVRVVDENQVKWAVRSGGVRIEK